MGGTLLVDTRFEQYGRTDLCFFDSPLSAKTGEILDRFAESAEALGVCGAQLAVHHDGTTVAIEAGELEHHGGRPVTRDTAFPIGSITKTFTAILAMALVADGDLELDEPLGEHLPELNDLGDVPTLRQLLSHTGGFASGPDSAELSSGSLRRYVADHCRPPNLVLPPGTGFSYSNMGYVLTGLLVETITGMSWSEAMASIVLKPLGIEPAFVVGGPPSRPVATGHSVNSALGRVRPVRQSLGAAEAPAGALCASAVDLLLLGLTQVAPGVPELLPPDHAEAMRRPVPGADPFGLADGWGLGLAVYDAAPSPWIGHDGNADGTACHLRIDTAGGWIIALTTNTNTGTDLWRDVLAGLAGAGLRVPSGTDPRPPRRHGGTLPGPSVMVPRESIGVYANGDTEYRVSRTDGGFSLTLDGEHLMMVAGDDGLTFALVDPSSGQRLPGGRFRHDPVTGQINGIQVMGRLARRRAGTE